MGSEEKNLEGAATRPGPEVLDELKRERIIALVANGSSRRVAARYVGCSPSTITRTAARDERFAQQLARAEQNLEIEVVQMTTAALEDIPEECWAGVIGRLDRFMEECERAAAEARWEGKPERDAVQGVLGRALRLT